jgi:hypothetical protein
MHCWNCEKECADDARFCRYCEADLHHRALGAAERAHLLSALDRLPPEDVADLKEIVSRSKTAQEFIRRIAAEACPRCGSSQTEDCGDDPLIDDDAVGHCWDCDLFWCSECGEVLDAAASLCPHWAVCDECDADQDEHGCGVMTSECDTILEWKRTRAGRPPAA